MFFDEQYDDIFDPDSMRVKNFPLVFCIGTSLQTGLSIRIASQAEEIIEINP